MLSKQREALEKELQMLDTEQVEADKEEKEDKCVLDDSIVEEDVEEDDDDDLESMMRRFVEKEQACRMYNVYVLTCIKRFLLTILKEREQ